MEHRSVVLKVNSEDIEIGERECEQIKQAMITFFSDPGKYFLNRYPRGDEWFKQELERSECWMGEGNSVGIGIWKLEGREQGLFLVRYPPPGDTAHIFYAVLSKKDNRWIASSFNHERSRD